MKRTLRTTISFICLHGFFLPGSPEIQAQLDKLAPRKIRGVVSRGMILFAENAEGNLIRVLPEVEVESGNGVS